MKILLINNNPVVSRLTALSARKENIEIDEIKNISELRASNYDIIFVDGESYNNDVSNIIRNSGVEKRVLFYSQGEEDTQSFFTQSILKPFLPSEVSEILRESKLSLLKEKEEKKKEDSKKSVIFDDLVEGKREKELEVLNVVEKKDKFDEKLEEAFPLDIDGLSNNTTSEIQLEESDKKETKKYEKDMFTLDDDLFELDDKKDTTKDINNIDNMDSDLFELDKEIKKDILDDNAPLDFDLESKEEVDFESKTEKEIEVPKVDGIKEEIKLEKEPEITPLKEIESNNMTKILDNTEISNIKDILDGKEGAESLTTVPASLMSIEKKIIEEENFSDENSLDMESIEAFTTKKKKKNKNKSLEKLSTGDAIAHTLNKLPVEDLRKLLRGAKVNVSIEFPNDI